MMIENIAGNPYFIDGAGLEKLLKKSALRFLKTHP